MFSKGSRYRNLPESSPVNAEGERLRSKELRIIPATAGRFLHTVREGDRLDLLAFKYYGDETKWWQICDANQTLLFPTDLLDRQPVMEERFVLMHSDFVMRFKDLLEAFSNCGEVIPPMVSSFDGKEKPGKPDFLESTVVVVYEPLPTTRKQILDQIKDKKFHFLHAFAWTIETNTAEAFTFDDLMVKSNWQSLVDKLVATPGILQAQSIVTEATLRVVYNSAILPGETILAQVKTGGFDIQESSTFSRIGTKIIIPPNQIV